MKPIAAPIVGGMITSTIHVETTGGIVRTGSPCLRVQFQAEISVVLELIGSALPAILETQTSELAGALPQRSVAVPGSCDGSSLGSGRSERTGIPLISP
jgi:hypothetical protein